MPGRFGAVLVAHGSADPQAAVAVRALARAVAAARPVVAVRVAYLDHGRPGPGEALTALAAAGCQAAVVVPLLLTDAYHGRIDLPATIARAREAGLGLPVCLAGVLGPGLRAASPRSPEPAPPSLLGSVGDPSVPEQLLAALQRRLAEATAGDGRQSQYDAVVLAAAGTRDRAARATVDAVATGLAGRLETPCSVAYASAAGPTPAAAVADLLAAGARRVAVAAYFLAPGRLYRIAEFGARRAGAVVVARPIADAPEVAALVLSRIDQAAGIVSARPPGSSGALSLVR